jgi:hypothetical protein
MHHPPVQRKGPLAPSDREILELCAEGWSAKVMADLLGIDLLELRARTAELCERLGVEARPDGRVPRHAAQLLLVGEARAGDGVARAA